MNCLPHILVLALHSQPGFNTVVPGAGAFCRHGAYVAGAGAYANSEKAVERKVSQYAFVGWQPIEYKPLGLRTGLMAGAVNGYSYNSGRTLPMAASITSLDTAVLPDWVLLKPVKSIAKELHLTVIPPVRNVTPAVAQFSFTLRF